MRPEAHIIRFGPFELDLEAAELRRDGRPVDLPPQPARILGLLAAQPGRLVTREEIRQAIWSDTVHVDYDRALNFALKQIRDALHEDAGQPRYVETLRGRGYRFIGPTEAPHATGTAVRDRRRLIWGAAVAAVMAVMVGVAALLEPPRPASGAHAPAERVRVAVLPFENLTGNPEDDWLAGAFSDSLTSGLQRLDTLILVSRDRIVELYRQENIGEASAVEGAVLRRMAGRLAVRSFVHGSYQRVGGEIKVTARLVAVEDGAIQAQEAITDDFANLLTIEDDLARRFAERLRARVRPSAAPGETTSLEAYHALIEGRTLYAENRFSDALRPLTRATTSDPQYAHAWAVLSKTHARLSAISVISSGSANQLHRDALTYANRAVALAPDLYDAQIALALAYREMAEFEPWRAAAQKAIELNPAIAEAHALLADSYFAGNAFGCARDRDPALAEQHYRTAMTLDPRWAPPYGNLSYQFSWLGREAEALQMAENGLAVLAGNANLARARAHALVRLRRADEAEREIRRMIDAGAAMSGQDHLILGSVALARGDIDLAGREFQTTLSRLPNSAFHLAIARAYLENGYFDTGLVHVDQAVALEPSCAVFTAASPAFAPYRDTPAFRVRLAAWKAATSS